MVCSCISVAFADAIDDFSPYTNLSKATKSSSIDMGIPNLELTLNGDITLKKINSQIKRKEFEGNQVDIINQQSGDDQSHYNNVQLKTRGTSSFICTSKKSYQIKFDSKVDLFNLGKSKKWVLLANFFDCSFARNITVEYVYQMLGADYVWGGKFVNLVVNDANGSG